VARSSHQPRGYNLHYAVNKIQTVRLCNGSATVSAVMTRFVNFGRLNIIFHLSRATVRYYDADEKAARGEAYGGRFFENSATKKNKTVEV